MALSPSSDSTDATDLLKRVVARIAVNDRLTDNFTFVEDVHSLNYDKKGRVSFNETTRYETVFVEGLPYRRLLERNGKPLDPQAEAEEERRYQATVAERRRMKSQPKQTGAHREIELEIDWTLWPIMFHASQKGEVIVDGRRTTRLVLIPRNGQKPESDAAKDALSTFIELWIDATDELPVRVRIEYKQNGIQLLRGSVMELAFFKDPGTGTYLCSRSSFEFKTRVEQTELRGRTEQIFSGYKRFSVDVRIAPESSPKQ